MKKISSQKTVRLVALLLVFFIGCQIYLSPAPLVKAETSDVVIQHGQLELRFDSQMQLTLSRDGNPITTSAPAFQIELDGDVVTQFALDSSAQAQFTGQFGAGKQVTIIGSADTPHPIQLTLTIELYDDYPDTILAQATYTNQGAQTLPVDAVWSADLLLDRRLTQPTANPYDFKMLSMGTVLGNGLSDRIWDVASNSNFANYNGGDVTNPEFDEHWGGGGTPLTSIWGAEVAFTVSVVEPTIQIVGVPLVTQGNGLVRVNVEETNDLGDLAPSATFTTVHSSITVHDGDFFAGVDTFGRMLRQMGLLTRQYNPVDYAAHWDSFGLEERGGGLNPGDSEEVNDRLYIAHDLGLEWIAIDSGWDNGTGSCEPNSDIYANEAEFVDWIDELHSQGFNVSLWLDPGFGDDALLAAHPDWFIKNEDDSFFIDEWERYVMDPTVTAALDYMHDCVTKLVTPQAQGGWGINRFFLDGVFLVPPDYSSRHVSPHETELAGDAFYRVTYLAARAIISDFPLEFCPCGGAITAWIAPYFSMTSTSDPDVMVYRPHEVRTKLYKALLGADAPVNGDHIEGAGSDLHLDMNYMFPFVLGLGDVYQTYFWETAWRTNDPLGVGDKDLYLEWFGRYAELGLSQATYLNLYDLAYDTPGSHAIAKDGAIYYLFAPQYDQSFSGDIELRGLTAGQSYSVVDYENGTAWGSVTGPSATLNVTIPTNNPLLLKATPDSAPTTVHVVQQPIEESSGNSWQIIGVLLLFLVLVAWVIFAKLGKSKA